MKMLYIRHGQTDWNAKRLIQGRTDIPLNNIGREQAKAQAVILAEQSIDVVYCSPLQRARETAEIINQKLNLPLQIDNRLIERNYGFCEGKPLAGQLNEAKFTQNGAELLLDLRARVSNFLHEIAKKHDSQTVLVVAHGGIGRMVQECYCGKSKRLEHCVVLCFSGPPKQWIIDRFEEGVAILEREDESFEQVPRAQLPQSACEGSVLVRLDGAWQLDLKAEQARRTNLFAKQEGLFSSE